MTTQTETRTIVCIATRTSARLPLAFQIVHQTELLIVISLRAATWRIMIFSSSLGIQVEVEGVILSLWLSGSTRTLVGTGSWANYQTAIPPFIS
jgi:hypothetical protein